MEQSNMNMESENVAEQTEAEEMASLNAGYNRTTRTEEVPVEEVKEVEEVDEVLEEVEDEADPEPTIVSLADELKALKARVAASTDEPESIRKMHGEIGNINRTLKQLQESKAEVPPPEDPLAAALLAAEESAKEFPELVGPLWEIIKSLKDAKQEVKPSSPLDMDEQLSKAVSKIRERDAIEALADEHPDFETVRDTPEFKKWEATKTPEFQQKLRTTWNPAVVSRGLTEFKSTLVTKQKKQDRLASAVVAPVTSQRAKSTTLPDEEGLNVGYNRGRKIR